MKSYKVTVNGQSYDVTVEEVGAAPNAAAGSQGAAPRPKPAAVAAVPAGAAPAASGATVVKAPMPGALLAYKVVQGQAVKRGDVLLILEAMKMENEIVAPVDGIVTALRASEGASVATGDTLIELG